MIYGNDPKPDLDEKEREQCEECLAYVDKCDISQPVICKECLDKAASYDSADYERKVLLKAAKDALAELPEYGATYRVGLARGILKVVIHDCSKKEVEK